MILKKVKVVFVSLFIIKNYFLNKNVLEINYELTKFYFLVSK